MLYAPPARASNWLYLLSMVLILLLGSPMQSRSLSWDLLATEIVLILLPALVFIRLNRLDARAVLLLRWPGWRLVLLGLVIGAGVWGVGMALEAWATALLGYSPASLAAALPADPLNLAVFALALAVAAPQYEDVFFRGYLASAYGRYGLRAALLAWRCCAAKSP